MVTTLVDHNYVIGQVVRLLIPQVFGASALDEKQGIVIVIPSANQVVVDIDSTGIDPFIPIPAFSRTPPQIVAIGDVQTGAINATGPVNTAVFIPGSFIDISPA